MIPNSEIKNEKKSSCEETPDRVPVCVIVLTTVGCGSSCGVAPLAPDPSFARAVDSHGVTPNLWKI